MSFAGELLGLTLSEINYTLDSISQIMAQNGQKYEREFTFFDEYSRGICMNILKIFIDNQVDIDKNLEDRIRDENTPLEADDIKNLFKIIFVEDPCMKGKKYFETMHCEEYRQDTCRIINKYNKFLIRFEEKLDRLQIMSKPEKDNDDDFNRAMGLLKSDAIGNYILSDYKRRKEESDYNLARSSGIGIM